MCGPTHRAFGRNRSDISVTGQAGGDSTPQFAGTRLLLESTGTLPPPISLSELRRGVSPLDTTSGPPPSAMSHPRGRAGKPHVGHGCRLAKRRGRRVDESK